MKKTLVALAALAATGAFAQVSVTGEIAMGWGSFTDAANSTTSGLGIDTSTIDFGATEDLGGGMKLEAHTGFDTVAREGVQGGDTTLKLTTSAATFTVGSTKLADFLRSKANVAGWDAGGINGPEGRITSARTTTDWASVSVPFGPVTVALTHFEAGTGLGLGANTANGGATADQRTNALDVSYASGALKATVGFASFGEQAAAAGNFKNRTRAAATYDFGSFSLGGGVDSRQLNVGTRQDVLVSVAAPMGALTVGGWYANRTLSGTAADATYNGVALGASYALSKLTSIKVQTINFQFSGAAAAATATTKAVAAYSGTSSNATEILLVKDF